MKKKPKKLATNFWFSNFSTLTVWFFNFWPQIRILRVEILLGHISACLKTSILKFRLLWIYSYFSLKILSDVFDCFCLLFWSRSCLKSSGRLLGTISTKFRANPTTGVQVISSNLMLTWDHRGGTWSPDFKMGNRVRIFPGHLWSDLHENWWKLFPGVSRSFLNISGTKITAKNTKKNEIQNFKKIVKKIL